MLAPSTACTSPKTPMAAMQLGLVKDWRDWPASRNSGSSKRLTRLELPRICGGRVLERSQNRPIRSDRTPSVSEVNKVSADVFPKILHRFCLVRVKICFSRNNASSAIYHEIRLIGIVVDDQMK